MERWTVPWRNKALPCMPASSLPLQNRNSHERKQSATATSVSTSTRPARFVFEVRVRLLVRQPTLSTVNFVLILVCFGLVFHNNTHSASPLRFLCTFLSSPHPPVSPPPPSMDPTTPSRSSVSGPLPSNGASEPLTSTLDTTTLRPGSLFEKEREKLIAEISQGIESLLSNTNTLNRKLEESTSVGKEFEPIARLWGRFTHLMAQAGIPDPYAQQSQYDTASPNAAGAGATTQSRDEAEQGHHRRSTSKSHDRTALAASVSEHTLPPGVAPGGGTIYGQDD
ncbi:Dolichyl-diphosphooligosaccharide-protein glycosyltransferase subunit dad1 [Thecaphora frezii]